MRRTSLILKGGFLLALWVGFGSYVNLVGTRFELDEFTFISSEAAQGVGVGPAEKAGSDDDDDDIPLPPKKVLDSSCLFFVSYLTSFLKDKKKKKKKPKKAAEPVDESAEAGSPEVKPKKERKRLKRSRSDSEEEAAVEEEEEKEEENDSDYDAKKSKKKKKRAKDSESESDDVEEEKLERRKKRGDRKELDGLASLKRLKEKRARRDKPSHERERDKERGENNESGGSSSDSEPEDTVVVPVSTFLSSFRPRLTSSLLAAPVADASLVGDTPKRRSKFGEGILSSVAAPQIVPFERPRYKPPRFVPFLSLIFIYFMYLNEYCPSIDFCYFTFFT